MFCLCDTETSDRTAVHIILSVLLLNIKIYLRGGKSTIGVSLSSDPLYDGRCLVDVAVVLERGE